MNELKSEAEIMESSAMHESIDDDMEPSLEPIAIIGFSGRFPGAEDVEHFWENIRNGKESIDFHTEEELRQSGLNETLLQDPNYVKASATIKDAEMFDAGFFAFTPRESRLMDPQHRVFLESAWHALENAGIDTERCTASIGVFAGTNPDSYMNAYSNEKEFASASAFEKRLSSDCGFFATRVAYKLNLKGPAITIQTACSTSLVAISTACQHLMTYQCDVALAGAATVQAQRKTGYLFLPHGITSPDGHCRTFDENAKGTIGGEGVATVVLKRLEDAVADGDTIHAVIKGWALNNDGNAKVGFTAPSVDGQAEVIEMAQALAGISADSIGYIEAHGTGTELGDPIEVAALTQAFSATTNKTNYCALGSVKANVGHLDAAAGIAGLIKAMLVLKNKQIPPLVHFQKPNPKINLEASPFYINTQLKSWGQHNVPRRAGVSSFGMGGTNAHVVLEEGPDPAAVDESRAQQLLLVSARNKSQCNQAMENLANWIENHPEQALADIAYTLQTGRKQFDYSAACVAGNHADAVAALRQLQKGSVSKGEHTTEQAEIAFMFPGQGNQYINMGADLYQSEFVFREIVDNCSEIIKAEFDYDLREMLYPSQKQDKETATEKLTRTEYAQPALFVIEYAMAKLLMSWGIKAQAFIGHSIGEYVAATLACVFKLEDALKLVAHRGRLMQSASPGSMAAIPLSAEKLHECLPEDLSISVINEPGMCVVSGVSQSVNRFVESCEQDNMQCYPLHTSHAFHSAMMEEILDDFSLLINAVDFSAPKIPFISNVSGDWITDQQAMDPQYWVSHIRQPVLFSDGMRTLLEQQSRLFYEVGPGNSLSSVAQRYPGRSTKQHVLSSMRRPRDEQNDLAVLLESLGHAWIAGIDINWDGFYKEEKRSKVPLPGYPFEKKPYWIQTLSNNNQKEKLQDRTSEKLANINDWFYVPSWTRQPAILDIVQSEYLNIDAGSGKNNASKSWLIFDDQSELCEQLVKRLRHKGDQVITVKRGELYQAESEQSYTVSIEEQDYIRLIENLLHNSQKIDGIVYLWTLGGRSVVNQRQIVSPDLELSFFVPLFLVKALNLLYEKSSKQAPLDLYFVTDNVQQVIGSEEIQPEKSLVLGVNKVCTQEMPQLRARCIDLESCHTKKSAWSVNQNTAYILSEITQHDVLTDKDIEIAYRGQYRWLKTIEAMPIKLLSIDNETIRFSAQRLKQNGVYLITGGFGGIGRTLSEYLAENFQARLILTGRNKLPDTAVWDSWLMQHDDADAISRKINFVRVLEEKGAKVLSINCDVANFEDMKAAINTATAQFGDIDGVIHSAGVPAGGLIQLKDRQSAAGILAPKVQGAMVLDALFKDQSLDFMVFCSSLAAITGGIGQVDYTAGNIFLDALAMQRQRKGLYTVSINWDTWGETGMAVEVDVPAEYKARLQKNLDQGIRSLEGIEIFKRVLNQQYPQIIISTLGIMGRTAGLGEMDLEEINHDNDNITSTQSDSSQDDFTSENYIAPRNKTESNLCEIWQDMFGIAQIGIEDSFFDLGGHSLLAIQILSRINENTETHISLNEFFDAVTISNLAEKINQLDSQRVEINTIESTDDMVDGLSDDEVARMLAEKGVILDE